MNAADTVLALSWGAIFAWSLKAISAFIVALFMVLLPIAILKAVADR